MELGLQASASAVFDANKTAQAILGPTVYGSVWEVETLVTNTNSVGPSKLTVYKQIVSDGSIIDGTWSGNKDTNNLTNPITLSAGECLVAIWDGGDIGAVATIILHGRMETGR